MVIIYYNLLNLFCSDILIQYMKFIYSTYFHVLHDNLVICIFTYYRVTMNHDNIIDIICNRAQNKWPVMTRGLHTTTQKLLLDCIRECVPLRNFRNSTFPIWVSSKLKKLLAMKKQSHKQFKMLGGLNRYSIFSQLRAQCKFESKCLYSHYLRNIQNRLCVDPKSFWKFVRSKRGVSTIPDEGSLRPPVTKLLLCLHLISYLFMVTHDLPAMIYQMIPVHLLKKLAGFFLVSQLIN
ncbi:hypothetical protein QTP88_022703 [Uroleucon formosanum]